MVTVGKQEIQVPIDALSDPQQENLGQIADQVDFIPMDQDGEAKDGKVLGFDFFGASEPTIDTTLEGRAHQQVFGDNPNALSFPKDANGALEQAYLTGQVYSFSPSGSDKPSVAFRVDKDGESYRYVQVPLHEMGAASDSHGAGLTTSREQIGQAADALFNNSVYTHGKKMTGDGSFNLFAEDAESGELKRPDNLPVDLEPDSDKYLAYKNLRSIPHNLSHEAAVLLVEELASGGANPLDSVRAKQPETPANQQQPRPAPAGPDENLKELVKKYQSPDDLIRDALGGYIGQPDEPQNNRRRGQESPKPNNLKSKNLEKALAKMTKEDKWNMAYAATKGDLSAEDIFNIYARKEAPRPATDSLDVEFVNNEVFPQGEEDPQANQLVDSVNDALARVDTKIAAEEARRQTAIDKLTDTGTSPQDREHYLRRRQDLDKAISALRKDRTEGFKAGLDALTKGRSLDKVKEFTNKYNGEAGQFEPSDALASYEEENQKENGPKKGLKRVKEVVEDAAAVVKAAKDIGQLPVEMGDKIFDIFTGYKEARQKSYDTASKLMDQATKRSGELTKLGDERRRGVTQGMQSLFDSAAQAIANLGQQVAQRQQAARQLLNGMLGASGSSLFNPASAPPVQPDPNQGRSAEDMRNRALAERQQNQRSLARERRRSAQAPQAGA